MARFDLTDEEWTIIGPLLPAQGRGPDRKDDRKVLNGIFYILRTGAPLSAALCLPAGQRMAVSSRTLWSKNLGVQSLCAMGRTWYLAKNIRNSCPRV